MWYLNIENLRKAIRITDGTIRELESFGADKDAINIWKAQFHTLMVILECFEEK